MYNTIEDIPAKVYFKILSNGNLDLLSKEKEDPERLKDAWKTIEAEHLLLEEGKEDYKALDVPKKIESLWCKQEAIILAIRVLKVSEDAEMMDLLRSYGFVIGEDLDNELAAIENQLEVISSQINKLHLKLPKINKDTSAKTSFDKVVLSYGAITGLGFINTNKITLTQYYALIDTGNDKIKALESGSKPKSN